MKKDGERVLSQAKSRVERSIDSLSRAGKKYGSEEVVGRILMKYRSAKMLLKNVPTS